jgi:hypothetical protein
MRHVRTRRARRGGATPRSRSPAAATCSRVALAPYQAAVVRRVASQCASQRAFMLLHSPGSGKTISALAILWNAPKDARRVVVVPAALTSTYAPDGDVRLLLPDAGVRAAFMATVTVLTYEGVDAEPAALLKAARGALVVCDEAHRLLPLLRSERVEAPLRAGFAAAARLVLMTGTPVMRDASDLGALASLLLPRGAIPSDPADFRRRFFFVPRDAAKAGWLAGVSVTALGSFGALAGTLLPASKAVAAGHDALAAAAAGSLRGALHGVGAMTRWAATAGVLRVVSTSLLQVLAASLTRYAATRSYDELDRAALTRVLAPVTSYFSYEAEGSGAARLAFPKYVVHKAPVLYTYAQSVLLLRFTGAALTAGELFRLGMAASRDDAASAADQQSPAVFLEFARAVGNLGDGAVAADVRWDPSVPSGGPPASHGAYVVHGAASAAAAAAALACPKLEALAARLQLLAAGRGGHRAWAVDATGAFAPPRARLMPVVYSSFDAAGLQVASAYLSALNLPHLVLRGAADAPSRHAAVMAAALARYPQASAAAAAAATPAGAASPRRDGHVRGPLAVLLHPSLSEGLSFTHNPELIVLEPVRGFGTQEQVYARVLRRYPGAPEARDADRAVKTVTQMAAGWGSWSAFGASVAAWTKYYTAAGADWAARLSHLPPNIAASAYRHDSASPDSLAEDDTALQAGMVGALAASLATLDDATLGAACAAARGGPPPCAVCLRGACGCEAGAPACSGR